MIAIVATLKCQDGKNAEFEAIFRELSQQVRANEPGNVLYQLAKTSDPNTYKVLELYKDEAATAAHRDAEHFKAAGPKLGAVLGGRPEIERLTTVD
ncbi:MAG TPA: putative quinol monooxygenase [Phenylobacterium sp.]